MVMETDSKRRTGHFYFGEERTSVLWTDNARTQPILPIHLNLLGPATAASGSNVLMDIPESHPGYTHVALTVSSLAGARDFIAAQGHGAGSGG